MRWHSIAGSLALLMMIPAAAQANEGGAIPDISIWLAFPFILLLLCIAVLPLLADHFWHRNRNKGLVAVGLSLPVILALLVAGSATAQALLHGLIEYVQFIVLLAALYTISGGIVLEGSLAGRPVINGLFLVCGAILANFIGTTGASMLLIRPFLRINLSRTYKRHLPIFFIFIVSNLSGLLTPLGDPPLFLGYLHKVDFFWTLRELWPQWLLANGMVLGIFLVWDRRALKRELPLADAPPAERTPLRLRGAINFLFLGGVILAVLLKAQLPDWANHLFLGEVLMAAMCALSLRYTAKSLRVANSFSWAPIVEVAVLFLGIFVTMVPALLLLQKHGQHAGISHPAQYFWLTGFLSSFLDNAPTYLTFGTLASSGAPAGTEWPFVWLMNARPELLAAVSCGAVFMGANTYIGNGPNFMVKAITDEMGVPTPSFFGYMVYSGMILLPVFGLLTLIFFR